MSKLILITGDLATGKSTLAKNLSKKLLINCFTKDDIKEKFCDMYGFHNREENRQMSVKATNFMIHTFGVFCMMGQDIILEANFRHDEIERIKNIALQYNVDVRLIVLRGDLEVLFDRFVKRIPTRHPAHKSLHLDESFEKFSGYVLEQRQEELEFSPTIIDSVKHNEQEVLELALKACQ